MPRKVITAVSPMIRDSDAAMLRIRRGIRHLSAIALPLHRCYPQVCHACHVFARPGQTRSQHSGSRVLVALLPSHLAIALPLRSSYFCRTWVSNLSFAYFYIIITTPHLSFCEIAFDSTRLSIFFFFCFFFTPFCPLSFSPTPGFLRGPVVGV